MERSSEEVQMEVEPRRQALVGKTGSDWLSKEEIMTDTRR